MDTSKQKRVTLEDVAKDAGVSRATASLVVRGSKAISEQTTKKVHESMDRLGYVYDRVAASFRSRRSSTVGVIITDIGNPFFPELLASVQERLDEKGYTVLLGMTFESESKQRQVLETMLEHRVCGIIIAPVANTTTEMFTRLKKLKVPCILIGRDIAGAPADYIGTDFHMGTKLAVRHLAEQGHRRIAFLGGVPSTSAYEERLAGYLDALEESGLSRDERLIVPSLPTREGGRAAVVTVMDSAKPPTAALCHNDIVAFGAVAGLRSIGLAAGKDLALVGFDDIREAATSNPELTTVAVGSVRWGTEAADLLHKRIAAENEGPPVRIIVPPQLVIRDSSTHFMGAH